jgi:hypothetical protein
MNGTIGFGVFDGRVAQGVDVPCERPQQVGTFGEVPVQRAAPHLGRGGDVTERRRRVLPEHVHGRVEDGPAGPRPRATIVRL